MKNGKRYILIAFLGCFCFTSITAQQRCKITGTLGATGKYVSKVFIQYIDISDFSRHMDSADVIDDGYTFEINFHEPGTAFILLRVNKAKFTEEKLNIPSEEERVLQFFPDRGKVKITTVKFPFSGSIVTGSAANKQYNEFSSRLGPLLDSLQELQKSLKCIYASKDGDPDPVKDKVCSQYDKIYHLYRQILQKKDCRITAWLFSQLRPIAKYAPGDLTQQFYAGLNSSLKKRTYVIAFKNIIDFTEGTEAPNFTRIDQKGDTIRLSRFRGKYVLIEFWGSWCKPCRAENPNLVSLYDRFKSEHFEMIGIAKDGDDEAGRLKWLKAIGDDQLPWINVLYRGNDFLPLDEAYHVDSYPSNFLIDPRGKIVAKNLKGADLENKLKEVLSELK